MVEIGIWPLYCSPPIYISVNQEAMAGKCNVHNHAGMLILNMNGNIFQIYFTHKNF